MKIITSRIFMVYSLFLSCINILVLFVSFSKQCCHNFFESILTDIRDDLRDKRERGREREREGSQLSLKHFLQVPLCGAMLYVYPLPTRPVLDRFHDSSKVNVLCFMLYALCSMLYALYFMLYALCFMLYSLCSVLYAACYMLYVLCFISFSVIKA